MKKILLAKRISVVVVALCALVLLPACPTGDPDLVAVIDTIGSPTVNAAGSVELPVRVVVSNIGTGGARTFKVSVSYSEVADPGGFVVAFTVPGQTNNWYPMTSSTLAAGASVTFDGILTFHPSVRGVSVDITALADSCSGDEFAPAFCRVEESDETNNESNTITEALP